jgi:hypothetical protein
MKSLFLSGSTIRFKKAVLEVEVHNGCFDIFARIKDRSPSKIIALKTRFIMQEQAFKPIF